MSDVSGDVPSSAWVNSDSDSVQSASARSTAPSYIPQDTSALSRYYSFRAAAAASHVVLPSSQPFITPASGVSPAAGDVDAAVDGGRGEEKRVQHGVQVLEQHPDFMAFFFEHLTGCPPHGPFRYYAALTLVQRARRRYGLDGPATASATRGTSEGVAVAADTDARHTLSPSLGAGTLDESTTSAAASAPGMTGYAVAPEVLRGALTITNVLALMEACYDTRHLRGWELLYVPAEVRSSDVETLLAEQRAQRLRRSQGQS